MHKYIWCARGLYSILDYVLANKKVPPQVKDTAVYKGGDIYLDHFLVISTAVLHAKWKKQKIIKQVNLKMFTVHLLQDDRIRYVYQEHLKHHIQHNPAVRDREAEWEANLEIVRKAAFHVLGMKT